MKQKTFNKITTIIFTIFTLFHIGRILGQWQVNIVGWDIPMGVSYVVVFVTAYLAYTAHKFK